MIHFHGTPIGGSRHDAARFLMGRHAFVPFPRPDDLGAVADVCQSFAFDNGAFSLWKKDEELDVEGYIQWCYEWHRHPGFEWAVIPDDIDGDEADNDALIQAWPSDIRGVPVWHMHESIGRLERLCADWSIVALGSSGQWPTPGTNGWWKRMGKAMDWICDEEGRPPCRLHGLRMLDPRVFGNLPLASADSTNAGLNNKSESRFGMYCPPSKWQRSAVIAERIENHNSAPVWQRIDQHELFA